MAGRSASHWTRPDALVKAGKTGRVAWDCCGWSLVAFRLWQVWGVLVVTLPPTEVGDVLGGVWWGSVQGGGGSGAGGWATLGGARGAGGRGNSTGGASVGWGTSRKLMGGRT